MKTMARFARVIERQIEHFVEDKDDKNTKMSAKVVRQVLQKYLKKTKQSACLQREVFNLAAYINNNV